ncbi:MAG: Gfo/Idh/MocA family oxidoreductase [Terriglobia bacterium]
MDKRPDISRREFLKDTAFASAGAAVLGGLAPARVLGANDRIRVGVLGSGHRARYDMEMFQKVPGVEIVAVCDVYAPARAKALQIAGPDAQAYTNYHEVLDRKDIDAVLIGSPDHWHKQMLIDAVNAGKDAYVEKPICHSIEQGAEMVRAVDESKRTVQTGTQQRSWAHWKLGKEVVASGRLGKITMVHTYWYQKYDAKKDLLKIDPADLDWKSFLGDAPDQPLTDEKFHWWRWYWDFGGGILTDLLTHWIDAIQWYMDQPAPKTATTVGDLYAMDWQCPDTVTAVYEYPGDFMVTFTGSINSSVEDGGVMFCGSDATLKIDRSHLAVYPEGVSSVPGSLDPEPEIFMRSEHDGTLDNVSNFVECMRTGKTPNANIHVGFEAARTSWIGNAALKRGMKVVWDGTKGRVA